MPVPAPTVEELIATLKKSNLPTVLVEGCSDASIYRYLERQIDVEFANVMVCGCRSDLLKIYQRRSEFSHLKTAFMADRDLWVLTSVPPGHEEIVWTEGYSIENDLYAGSEIERLLDQEEVHPHKILLSVICRWFAFEVLEHQAGRDPELDVSIYQIATENCDGLRPAFVAKRGYSEPPPELVRRILAAYQTLLRGKQLMQCLVKFLSASHRKAKYSKWALVEICAKAKPNPKMERLAGEIRSRLMK
jgi:hypothetical protein